MRVLVVVDDAPRGDALARQLTGNGDCQVSSTSVRDVSQAVARGAPDALVLAAAEEDGEALRLAVERARSAAQRRLPALLLVGGRSHWLLGALPADLEPARVLPASSADASSMWDALAELVPGGDGDPPDPTTGGLRLDREERVVDGPSGKVRLTASEATLLAMIADGDGSVVTAEAIVAELWERTDVDRYTRGAIRSHIYTLRRKLSAIGLDGIIESLPGVGYRLRAPARGSELD